MMTHQRLAAVGLALAVIAGEGTLPVDAAPPTSGAMLLEGTIVTMNVDRDVIHNGSILVRDGRIDAMWQGGHPPEHVDVTDAVRVPLGKHAYIYPGLINLHDHPFFDMLPLWQPPSSHQQPGAGRTQGVEPYGNRYQWNAGPPPPEYLRLVANPSSMMTTAAGLGRVAEVIKFGKARMILGGTTTTQGGGASAAYDSLLARNVESLHFGRQRVFSRVPAIAAISANEQALVKGGMSAGLVDAWLVHLAEGVRDGDRLPGDPVSSRAEFDVLKAKGLLTDATVVVHGAGLEAADFAEMAGAPPARADGAGDGRGAKLVWSPLSNLLLYGKTAAVYDAIAAGVTVSLGTDWTPGGSPNLLTELKVADRALRDPFVLGGRRHVVPGLTIGDDRSEGAAERALDQLLVEMVTLNPARAVRWDDQVGSIEAGKVADLLVIDAIGPPDATGGIPASPYRRLIDATEQDVLLVMVGGDARAGTVDVMSALKPGDYEVVASSNGCFEKAIDVTSPTVPNGTQSLAQVKTLLADGLRALGGDHSPAGGGPSSPFTNTWSYLKARVPGAASLPELTFNFGLIQFFGMTADGKVNLESIELPPLFTINDDWWFATLENARGATGLTAADAPYDSYLSNANQLNAGGNPFAAPLFRERWYVAGCALR
jgi:5-methylthioadenosine/S-adenosylhomocysteine deaminase